MNPLVAALALLLATQQPVRYEVSFPNAGHHEAEIRVTFPAVVAETLEVRMARSSPGRYSLHEFAKNVYDVRVYDGRGERVGVRRPDPHGWDVWGHDGTVKVTYTLFADYANGTYSGIDRTHAHLNMPATFLWARGLEQRPIVIEFTPPQGARWRAATQLVPAGAPLRFSAADLDYFMDSPTELSDHALHEWQVEEDGGTYLMRVTVHHLGTEEEASRFAEAIRRLVEEARAVFGELPSFDHGTYTFIADYLPWVHGDGMEHRNSTILTGTNPLARSALSYLGGAAHELFHAWNVERMRPASLQPFDFEAANMSRELWFAEGFTSYYGELLQRRAGQLDDRAYAAALSSTVDAVINAPGRRYFSPVEMSMQAPFVDRASFVDETNYANTFLSYYTWGSAIALALDLTLRSRFAGLDLDRYMRAMWSRHGSVERPYRLEDLEQVLAELTDDPAFADSFFGRFIRGREVAAYDTLLARAGFLLRRAAPHRPSLGRAELAYSERGAEIVSPTLIDDPLYRAGLDRGDVITGLGGRRVRGARDVLGALSRHGPGDRVPIEYRSRGVVREGVVRLAEDDGLEVVPFEEANLELDAEARTFRRAWLGSRR
jgi:predicted metalloprotease with PDZ domain